MPTYEYRCKDCGEHLEVVQSFTDDSLTECPNCQGTLKKVFGNIGITFKGSGFYKTDSRSGSSSSVAADPGASTDAGSKKDTASKSEASKTDSNGSSAGSDSSSTGSSTTTKSDAGTSSSSGAGSSSSKTPSTSGSVSS